MSSDSPSPAAADERTRAAAGGPPHYWVGFGASAGGLDALRHVLRELPADAPATYVVVQHLSPQRPSVLTELLQRETQLSVQEVYDGVKPKAGAVYVTPANADVVVSGEALRLVEPSVEAAAPKPSVDRFLISLADAVGDKAIGVILSGTGTDGAYGVKAVRAAGGITIAQDAENAKYNGMPLAALSTQNVDLILPASQIGERFSDIIENARQTTPLTWLENEPRDSSEASTVEDIIKFLHIKTNIDFHLYKRATIARRIHRRMQALSLQEIDDYASIISSSNNEAAALAHDLMISVTSFFRDPHEFESFEEALKRRIAERPDQPLRIWTPACATGEEAYSIAMIATEALGGIGAVLGGSRLKVFATDLDTAAVNAARQGVFPEAALDAVPSSLRKKYFDRAGSACTAIRELRTTIVFSPHNIFQDPPFLNMDIISCRNLLIYFQPELQERVLARFHYSLNEGGLLFLGKSESIGGSEALFKRAGRRGNVFVRRFAGPTGDRVEIQAQARKPIAPLTSRRKAQEREHGLEMFDALVAAVGPNAILADSDLNVVKSYGDVSKYTTLSPGVVSTSIGSLVAPPLRHELRSLASRALRDGQVKRGVAHMTDDRDGREQMVVYPLRLTKRDETMALIVFDAWRVAEADRAQPTGASEDAAEFQAIETLQRDLIETRENLQEAIEQLETSNEELHSLNEELQTSNEEFQSTNEELETANEELQSTNEELITVNDELNTTAEELRWATHDLENVLEEAPTPIIVVDRDFIISRLSGSAKKFFEMPRVDHPHISQVPSPPGMPPLLSIVEDVLEKQASYERYFESETFAARVSARLYNYGRTSLTAVVISIVELTELVKNRRELQQLFDMAPVAILEQDGDGNIKRRNSAMIRYIGDNIERFDPNRSDRSILPRDPLNRPLSVDEIAPQIERIIGRDGVERWIRLIRRVVENNLGRPSRIYAIGTDVSELIETQRSLSEQTSLLKMSQKLGRIGHWRYNVANNLVSWSDELFRLAGEDRDFFRPTVENMVQLFADDDRETVSGSVRAAIDNQEPFSLTARLRTRSGRMRVVDWSGRPEIGADGSVAAVIGIVRDMTEIHEREADLRRTMEELARSNAELSRFSYVCSHDMREPVRTIASMIALLQEETGDGAVLSAAERSDLMRRIGQNTERLLEIIEGLLAYSRLEGRIEASTVDLQQLIAEILANVRLTFPNKSITLEATDIPKIQGAYVHLQQLFQNLIVNAVKFSKDDAIHIDINCTPAGDFWEFEVADNGPGVPEEFREDIFLMFRRLNRKDEMAGSGLGLGICRRIVEQHGGAIRCDESPAGGASFVFTIAKMGPFSAPMAL